MTGFLEKKRYEKYFDYNYVSTVVLANPKTILNDKFAKKNIKNKVLRADQLINYINHMNDIVDGSMNDNDMQSLAQFFLDNSQPNKSDYSKKYEDIISRLDTYEAEKNDQVIDKVENRDLVVESRISRDDLIIMLKAYRITQSRKENVKAYYIFNDSQMNDLIDKKPTNKTELLNVSGFGNVKIEKYGEDILNILNT